jgi:hypothetical protein
MTNMLRQRFGMIGMVLLTLAASACGSTDRCVAPGVTATCSCGGDKLGARACREDRTWASCDCSGAIALPNPIINEPRGAGGAGGVSGTGGRGVTPGSGGGVAPMTDGGAVPLTDGGGGPMIDGGASGTGGNGTGGAGGTGGAEPVPLVPYGPCMATADCGPNADCVITPGFPTSASVCASVCVDVGDCPKPAGTYDAVVTCVTGYCKIDCTPVLFAALLSCPTGMVCVAPLFGLSYCHDDGI